MMLDDAGCVYIELPRHLPALSEQKVAVICRDHQAPRDASARPPWKDMRCHEVTRNLK